MPEIQYYLVEQTREVRVAANSAADAITIAVAAFTHGQDTRGGLAKDKGPEGVWGNTISRIKETTLRVDREN